MRTFVLGVLRLRTILVRLVILLGLLEGGTLGGGTLIMGWGGVAGIVHPREGGSDRKGVVRCVLGTLTNTAMADWVEEGNVLAGAVIVPLIILVLVVGWTLVDCDASWRLSTMTLWLMLLFLHLLLHSWLLLLLLLLLLLVVTLLKGVVGNRDGDPATPSLDDLAIGRSRLGLLAKGSSNLAWALLKLLLLATVLLRLRLMLELIVWLQRAKSAARYEYALSRRDLGRLVRLGLILRAALATVLNAIRCKRSRI